ETVYQLPRVSGRPLTVCQSIGRQLIEGLPQSLLESGPSLREKASRPFAECTADLVAPALHEIRLHRVAHDLKAQRVMRSFPRLDYHGVSQQPRQNREVFDDPVRAQGHDGIVN